MSSFDCNASSTRKLTLSRNFSISGLSLTSEALLQLGVDRLVLVDDSAGVILEEVVDHAVVVGLGGELDHLPSGLDAEVKHFTMHVVVWVSLGLAVLHVVAPVLVSEIVFSVEFLAFLRNADTNGRSSVQTSYLEAVTLIIFTSSTVCLSV